MDIIEKRSEYLLDALKHLTFFQYLNERQFEQLIQVVDIIQYEKQEIIISDGDTDPYFYIIINGEVHVTANRAGKENIYICSLSKNNLFGEAAIFTDVKRTANIIANEQVQLLRIKRDSILRFVNDHPKAGIKFLMMIIYSMLGKLREANQELAFERHDVIPQNDIDDLVNKYLDK